MVNEHLLYVYTNVEREEIFAKLFQQKVYKGVHVLDKSTYIILSSWRHSMMPSNELQSETCGFTLGTQSLHSSILHAILFQAWPVVTYPSAGTCCVTCQGRCHRYFGGWKGTEVSTPCNQGTKSETEMHTNNVTEPYAKPSKFVSRHELRKKKYLLKNILFPLFLLFYSLLSLTFYFSLLAIVIL